ncbi:hypothetical protein EON62_03705 [archaeon]|nr:MAG: hypothetical protein EON62_03705 [archaeon]
MPPRAMPKRRDAGPRVAGRGVGVPYGRADGYMVGGPTSPSRYTPQLGAYRSNFASFLAALSPGGGKHHDDDDEASAFASDADSVMPSHFHRPGPAGYAPPPPQDRLQNDDAPTPLALNSTQHAKRLQY